MPHHQVTEATHILMGHEQNRLQLFVATLPGVEKAMLVDEFKVELFVTGKL